MSGRRPLAVVVIDESAESLELAVTASEVLDVSVHANAHAAFRGIDLVEASLDVAA